jgi:hypothetical protein
MAKLGTKERKKERKNKRTKERKEGRKKERMNERKKGRKKERKKERMDVRFEYSETEYFRALKIRRQFRFILQANSDWRKGRE